MVRSLSVLVFATTALLAGAHLLAAERASLGGDLKATIVLQGFPCDQISESKRNADSDYNAACKDGNRYHVFINAQGRVVVEKL